MQDIKKKKKCQAIFSKDFFHLGAKISLYLLSVKLESSIWKSFVTFLTVFGGKALQEKREHVLYTLSLK